MLCLKNSRTNKDKNKLTVNLVFLSDQLQMDQKPMSVVDQELLEPLSNQIGSKAKASINIKHCLWIIGTLISLLIVVMVVIISNHATNTSKEPSLANDLDYYVYEDYAHSDQDNEYDYKDYGHIGGNSREDADITKVRPQT